MRRQKTIFTYCVIGTTLSTIISQRKVATSQQIFVQFYLNDCSQISLKQLHSVKTFDSKCVGFGEK